MRTKRTIPMQQAVASWRQKRVVVVVVETSYNFPSLVIWLETHTQSSQSHGKMFYHGFLSTVSSNSNTRDMASFDVTMKQH